MLAVLAAALLSVTAAADSDTLVTADGTRVSGVVVEENPSRGVKLKLPDGTIRTYGRAEVSRIEFADGSVSTWSDVAATAAPPPPPAQAAPPPAPAPAPQAEGIDTVFFVGGGRVRGLVLEDTPREGVTIRLLDGTLRTYPRRDIARIEYSDGSVTRRRERQQPPPPPRAPAPPPTYAPPPSYPQPAAPPPRAEPRDRGQVPVLAPVYLAGGVGATLFTGGEAEEGVRMWRLFEPQAHLSLEGGVRLSPAFALGLYADVGAGDPGRDVRAECRLAGLDCTASSGRFGLLLRHTWDPLTPTSKWMSIGTGWEFARVSTDDRNDEEIFTYTGREYLRVGAGIDFRQSAVVGVGFYGSVGWGAFKKVEDVTGRYDVDEELHSTVQLGVRLTLFP